MQGKDFRGSAFKGTRGVSAETEVDPLEFPRGECASIHELDLIAELSRRVAHLEERVSALQVAESSRGYALGGDAKERKRNRRKFGDLVRDHEVDRFVCSVWSASKSMARRQPSRTMRSSNIKGGLAKQEKTRELGDEIDDNILLLVRKFEFLLLG